MKLLSIREWGHLTVGPDPGHDCTRAEADRLIAVARASALGGTEGARILTDQYRRLRAGQVVGVLAAEGAQLEILPKIDFPEETDEGETRRIRDQLIHMLGIAHDLKIAPGAAAALGLQHKTLLEILIGLFAHRLIDAVRLGFPRRYISLEEDLPALRGRLVAQRQFTTLAASPQWLACRYDDLSADIALNRIMKAAVTTLARIAWSAANQRALRELRFAYADIADVPARMLAWDEVVLDRTNERWHALVAFARLLLGDRFQTTSSGGTEGVALLFEMNTLFERYVARLLARTLAGTGLTVHPQSGGRFCLEALESDERPIFQTWPDILVKRGGEIVHVIDTKWKRITTRIDDPKQGVAQGDVYQMMAYGRLYGCPRLTLLYPHHAALGVDALNAAHRIAVPGCHDRLTLATIDVTSHAATLEGLRSLSATASPPLQVVT